MKQAMIDYIKKPKFDEFFTPEYAIKPLLKYLKPNSIIWCPFDTEESNFLKVLKKAGHKVITTHKDDFTIYSHDFFDLLPSNFSEKIDYIISNPPFSIKSKVIEKLYELGIPFAMLMPLTTLEGVNRNKLFKKYGIELLLFDRRIDYTGKKKIWFNTSYFCNQILPKSLIFEALEKDIK